MLTSEAQSGLRHVSATPEEAAGIRHVPLLCIRPISTVAMVVASYSGASCEPHTRATLRTVNGGKRWNAQYFKVISKPLFHN